MVDLAADPIRFRFHERAVWILGTDPLVLGLAQGLPKRDWREFAAVATGIGDGYAEPVPPLLAPPGNNSARPVLDCAFFGAAGYPGSGLRMSAIEEQLLLYSNNIRLNDDLTFVDVRFEPHGAA